jgi:phage terminase large subunit GpA-like protein
MTDSGLGDRRFRTASPSSTPECRLCWRTVVLEREHIEATEQHVYVRCPHCGGSFPIRHSDLEAFLGHESSATR